MYNNVCCRIIILWEAPCNRAHVQAQIGPLGCCSTFCFPERQEKHSKNAFNWYKSKPKDRTDHGKVTGECLIPFLLVCTSAFNIQKFLTKKYDNTCIKMHFVIARWWHLFGKTSSPPPAQTHVWLCMRSFVCVCVCFPFPFHQWATMHNQSWLSGCSALASSY